jgi:hypothetical protein
MNTNHVTSRELVIDSGQLALHVVKRMTIAHKAGERCTLDTLVRELKVRRADVRRVLSALHEEGVIDVLHMRLTLGGFAIGHSLADKKLPPFRIKPLRSAAPRHAA